MYQFIMLQWYDYLKNILIKINVATGKDNSRNGIWHWTNDQIGE